MTRLTSVLRRRAERACGRLRRVSGILMYHRVARETHDPWNLCVAPEDFAEQMSGLRRHAEPKDLVELALGRGWKKSDRVPVAVTFDDGYGDNLANALPILEKFEIPATIFIASGQIGSRREYWWDALERCILRPAELPRALELVIGGEHRIWTVESSAADASDGTWRADLDGADTPRHALFLELWNALVLLDPEDRERVLDMLMTWSSVEHAAPAERLAMDEDDILRLSAHPLIEIGAHTIGHVSLPHHAPLQQRHEIEGGKQALEELIGRPVTRFAFPYGRLDRVSLEIVRDLKFVVACTSRPGPVTPAAKLLQLPRLQAVSDGGARQHSERLRHWLPAFGA